MDHIRFKKVPQGDQRLHEWHMHGARLHEHRPSGGRVEPAVQFDLVSYALVRRDDAWLEALLCKALRQPVNAVCLTAGLGGIDYLHREKDLHSDLEVVGLQPVFEDYQVPHVRP